jgi:hypothetical protein
MTRGARGAGQKKNLSGTSAISGREKSPRDCGISGEAIFLAKRSVM